MIAIFVILTAALQPYHTYANTSDNVISKAKEHIGVPYRMGGTSPSGFDCSGFIYYVFNQIGMTLPRTAAGQYGAGTSVSKSNLEPGDLVFFETYKRGPSHSGIYVGDNQFIHASSSRGIMISSINDPHYWAPRYLGARRVLEEAKTEVLAPLPVGYFHDVPESHWAFNPIHEMSIEGIINGFDNSIYKPEETVTKAQAAALISTVQGLNTGKQAQFADITSNHWALGAISATVEAGYFTVGNDNRFDPNKPMTRAEVAELLRRAYQLDGNGTSINFTDVATNNWAYEAIRAAAGANLMNGFPDDTYRPNERVTRAQFARILQSAMNLK